MTTSVLFILREQFDPWPDGRGAFLRSGTAGLHSRPIRPASWRKPIHRFTFRVMEEIGHDLYGYAAKSIFEFNHLERVDFLITLSDTVNEHYVFNENHIGCRLHWPFRNPLVEILPGRFVLNRRDPTLPPLLDQCRLLGCRQRHPGELTQQNSNNASVF